MKYRFTTLLAFVIASALPTTHAAEPADFTITDTVLRPAEKVPPIGTNNWGKSGTVEWAANNFVNNSGNEFPHWNGLHRVTDVFDDGSFDIEVGTSWHSLYACGFLSGANVRVYRLVDKAGNPLPLVEDSRNPRPYFDVSKADRAILVADTQILPEGTPGFPDGGWLVQKYLAVYPLNGMPPDTTSCTNADSLENGREYWYTVIAVGADGRTESDPSNEVSATPTAGLEKLPSSQSKKFEILPVARKLSTAEKKAKEAAEKKIARKAAKENARKAKDAGETAEVVVATPEPTLVVDPKPAAPSNLKAVAGDGCVTLTWTASPTEDIQGYRLLRSTVPAAKQVNAIYLDKSAPKILPWDYIVVNKKFTPFNMKYVSPRVRGMGTDMNSPKYYWSTVEGTPTFAQVAHDSNLPTEMRDPGEACLQITAADGKNSISQNVFTGAQGIDTHWYGQLEPDKKYRAEIWLRQEGLINDGRVKFLYGQDYPGIEANWDVKNQWQKFIYDFEGPERPGKTKIFGHTLEFEGPGKLWMDNFRIFAIEAPGDEAKPYSPGRIVLDELLRSQPTTGRKGVHRIWFLKRDASMDSILSWHASSVVNPNWNTPINPSIKMTLPMGLEFDLLTGDSPANRMRPWIVIQHILHSEQDWKNLIEFLSAPYDPAKDSPATKPYAARRVEQRSGVTTPWTDEFSEITIEFGNETWHNGAIENWIGFSRHRAVWQGGYEYGYFAQYLINNAKSSPYWKSQNLDSKIKFNLGGGYSVKIEGDVVTGYGEEAMQNAPDANSVGHANYVGPKWETKEEAHKSVDDVGFQATLLGFVANPDTKQREIGRSQEVIQRTHKHQYEITAYEGGPSGYPNLQRGKGTKDQTDVGEAYGKSLAMAVAALDSWLRSYEYGWTDQAYLGYVQGMKWTSHSPILTGFRPFPGWMALTMRNRFASGDYMQVTPGNVPQIDWRGQQYPGIAVFALRDDKKWCVFVLSRFLNESTPVTLNLPFQSAQKVTMHWLDGATRDNNLEEQKIVPKEKDLPATSVKDGSFKIESQPPGSISLYIFDI